MDAPIHLSASASLNTEEYIISLEYKILEVCALTVLSVALCRSYYIYRIEKCFLFTMLL